MNILLVTPFVDSTRGNFITARRWTQGLMERGVTVTLDSSERLTGAAVAAFSEKPDLIHAHHAVHCGLAAAEAAQKAAIPLVISLGGTDWYADHTAAPDPDCLKAMARADAVISPAREPVATLKTVVPDTCQVFYVRRGIRMFPKAVPPSKPALNGLMAGGLRPVKGQLDALRWVEGLRRNGIPATLTMAGPALDAAYAAAVERMLARQPQDRWIGQLPHEDMPHCYARADFLLNASENEGASNAVLEALAQGCPVAARNCPGNRQLLSAADPDIACVFPDTAAGLEALGAWLAKLMDRTPQQRSVVRRKAVAHVTRHHHATDEIDELIRVYRAVLRPPARQAWGRRRIRNSAFRVPGEGVCW